MQEEFDWEYVDTNYIEENFSIEDNHLSYWEFSYDNIAEQEIEY
jgi:hypothetical protein